MLPDLRPRSATEVVDAGVQLFRRHAGPLLILAAIVAIPQWLISLVMSTAMPAPDTTDPFTTLAPTFGVLLPGFVLLLAWLSLGFGAMVHMGSSAYLGNGPGDAVDALRRGARFVRPLIVANLLGYLRAIVLSMVVLFVLSLPLGFLGVQAGGAMNPVLVGVLAGATGLVVIALFCAELGRVLLATPAAMFEDVGGLRALKRGRALTSGYVARAAVLIFVTALIALVVSFGSLAAASALLPMAVASVVGSVLMLPLYPIIACITVVMYYDLRVRKEGFDIDLLAGATPAVPGA